MSAYDQVEREIASGRSLEARALIRSAMRLIAAINSTDQEQLFEAVSLNNKLWLLFYSEIDSGHVSLPEPLRSNIISLAKYVFGAAAKAFTRDKATLESLATINRRIASGLSVEPADGAAPAQPAPPPSSMRRGTFSTDC